jgi:hypothetical protein
MPEYIISVLRAHHRSRGPAQDCTNGGVTGLDRDFAVYLLLEEYALVPESPRADTCYLRIVRRERYNDVIAVPATERVGQRGMMGGNFVWSSDSRFRSGVSEQPIPVHDRFEGS